MAKFIYTAEDFGPCWGASLSGTNELACSWDEIVWAAITVGKRNWSDVWKHRNYSMIEAVFRASIIFAYFMEDGRTNNIVKSVIYKDLDPSEKSAVSYFHGIILSKILANRLFNVPWLMHLDVYKSRIRHHIVNNSRPDLIGLNVRREWFIFEAKGRSNSFNRDSLEKAKNQTRQLRTIEGQFPVMRAAVQSYFSINNSLRVKISDPDEYDENAIDLDINFTDFLYSYYRLIIDLLDYKKEDQTVMTINQNQFIVIELDDIDISIGLHKELYKYLKSKDLYNIEVMDSISLLRRFNEKLVNTKNQKGYIGKDGIVVQCGELWSNNSMQKQPNERC
jgi:hypothetical protein